MLTCSSAQPPRTPIPKEKASLRSRGLAHRLRHQRALCLTRFGPAAIPVIINTPEAEMTNRSRVATAIQVGDTVAYTAAFLDHHSRYHNDMLSALGKVIALHHLESGMILADIGWNKPSLPKRVNIKNLTNVIAASPEE